MSEQLVKYLTDAHSIEVQALAQLRTAPDLAADPENSAAFREHLRETEEHERCSSSATRPRRGSRTR
jgi:ferritin-like metal-binding protein YciE